MSVELMRPAPPPDAWDRLAKALNIGMTIYKIPYDIDQFKMLREKHQAEMEDINRKKQGIYTPLEIAALGDKFQSAPIVQGQDTPLNAFRVKISSGEKNPDQTLKYTEMFLKPKAEPDKIGLINQQIKNLETENLLKQSAIRKNNAETMRVLKEVQGGALNDKNLPIEVKLGVQELTKKSMATLQIKNTLQYILDVFDNKKIDEDHKIQLAEDSLKAINSIMTDNPDAVGKEEAGRLSSFLNYKWFNVTKPGSFFGRDVNKFRDQAASLINLAGSKIQQNSTLIKKMKNTGEFLPVDLRPIDLKYQATSPKNGNISGGIKQPDLNKYYEEF